MKKLVQACAISSLLQLGLAEKGEREKKNIWLNKGNVWDRKITRVLFFVTIRVRGRGEMGKRRGLNESGCGIEGV